MVKCCAMSSHPLALTWKGTHGLNRRLSPELGLRRAPRMVQVHRTDLSGELRLGGFEQGEELLDGETTNLRRHAAILLIFRVTSLSK